MPEEGAEEEVRAFRITGRVQGVGFRWWTRRTAESLGVSGSVRNCRDGSVEVKAAGSEAALDRFRAALAEGPPPARVEEVRTMDADPNTNRSSFSIVR